MQSETDHMLDGTSANEPMTVDITPTGCKTPEGAAKVADTLSRLDDATAALANAAIEFFDTHEEDILHAMEMYEGVAEDLHQIRALIGARNRKQEAFSAAAAGQ